MSAAMKELYAEAKRLCGQVAGEHGIGYSKREYLRESLGKDLIEPMRGIKAVFDPNMVLNPDKIF